MVKSGFTKCRYKYGVYMQSMTSDVTLICFYVDDLLVISNNKNNLKRYKQLMMKEFEMTYLGNLSCFLGMEFPRTKKDMIFNKRKYVREVLKRLIMVESKPATFSYLSISEI